MEAGGGELVTPEIPVLVAPDPALLDERQKRNFDLLIAQAADAISVAASAEEIVIIAENLRQARSAFAKRA